MWTFFYMPAPFLTDDSIGGLIKPINKQHYCFHRCNVGHGFV